MSKYDFQNGYLCALSCIVKGHGNGIEVREALSALGPVNWSKVEPYDREVLAEVRREVKRGRSQGGKG